MGYTTLQTYERRITPLNWREQLLWVVAIILLAIDVATTWYVISRFGLVAEANPFMTIVIGNFGFTGLVVSKVGVFAFGFSLREVIDSHRWVVPFGVILPSLPVAVLNLYAVSLLL